MSNRAWRARHHSNVSVYASRNCLRQRLIHLRYSGCANIGYYDGHVAASTAMKRATPSYSAAMMKTKPLELKDRTANITSHHPG